MSTTVYDPSSIAVERGDEPGRIIPASRSGYLIMQPFQAPADKGKTMIVIAQEVG